MMRLLFGVIMPVVLLSAQDDPWQVRKPASKPIGKPVILRYALKPGTAFAFEYSTNSTLSIDKIPKDLAFRKTTRCLLVPGGIEKKGRRIDANVEIVKYEERGQEVRTSHTLKQRHCQGMFKIDGRAARSTGPRNQSDDPAGVGMALFAFRARATVEAVQGPDGPSCRAKVK